MVLLQDVLIYTANNITEQPDYPLIQSMVRFFSLFKVKVQFDNDEVIGAWIW